MMFDKNGPCGSLTADLARTIIYNTATRQDWAYPWCQLPDQPKHLNALTAVNAVTAGSCGPVVGDLNCDSILDGSDLDGFSVCMTGPRTDPIGGGCTCADFPASPPDGDVDLHDFMYFQRLFGGGQSTAATVTLDLTSPNAGQVVEPGGTVYWTVSATVSQGDNAGLAAISVDLVQDPPSGRLVDMSPATTVGTGMDGFVRPAGISNPETDVPGAGYGGTPVARNLRQIGGAQNTLGEAGDTGTGEDVIVDPGIGQSGPQIIAQGSFTIPLVAGTYVFRIENGLANVLDVVSPPPSPPAAWPVSAANVVLNSPSFSVIVPYDLAVPDFDRDGDVDQNDFALMQACYTGNTYTIAQLFPGGDCDAFDLDGDGHVKMRDPGNPTETLGDLDWLEKCASGPGIRADSDCCDCDGHGYLDARDNPPDPWVNNFDYDGDGIQVLGRPNCTGGNTLDCDDNCPCQENSDQADDDADGIGDVCDPTPYNAPSPDPLDPCETPENHFTITAWRSVRTHGAAGS
ncbi:MAG TPA: hypothetical protein PLL20_21540, partial [Phycisphaerae bacterium]|nr:hypothetical protein [Phycisphaerae bacterium]